MTRIVRDSVRWSVMRLFDWLVAAFKGKRAGFARTTRIGHSLTIEPATAAAPRGKHSSIDLDQVPFGPEAITIIALHLLRGAG